MRAPVDSLAPIVSVMLQTQTLLNFRQEVRSVQLRPCDGSGTMQRGDSQAEVCYLARPRRRHPRKAILVLGMSRSGTSLIAHILHTLGASLPDDLIGPNPGNPTGHWEPRALVEINDQILSHVRLAWNDPRPLPDGWVNSAEAHGFALQIKQQIEREYSDSRLLLIKDPRLCRLLPLYCDALEMMDIEPSVVLQVRPPAEVVRSLCQRDGIAANLSQLLWLRSVTEAEWHSRDYPRIWLDYAQLTADWRASIHRVGDRFDVTWPIPPETASEQIKLLHLGLREPDRSAQPPILRRAWAAIDAGLADDEPAARAGFDAVRQQLCETDQLYVPIVTDLVQRHAAQLQTIRRSTCWRLTAPLRALRLRTAR
jgi:hypothetical protein